MTTHNATTASGTKPSERKPLRTQEEIYAAYPEHKKLMENSKEIDTVMAGLHKLERTGYLLAENFDDENGDRWEPLDHWSVKTQIAVYAAYGIDYNTIMAEKDDMLKQIGMAWENAKYTTPAPAGQMPHSELGRDDDAPRRDAMRESLKQADAEDQGEIVVLPDNFMTTPDSFAKPVSEPPAPPADAPGYMLLSEVAKQPTLVSAPKLSKAALRILRKMAMGDKLHSNSQEAFWNFGHTVRITIVRSLVKKGLITLGKPYGASGGNRYVEHELTDAGYKAIEAAK